MKKDSFILGFITGVLAPIIAFLLTTYTSFQQDYFANKPIALYVLAAVINLIVVRFIYRAGYEKFAKGIILLTFLAMLVLIFGSRVNI